MENGTSYNTVGMHCRDMKAASLKTNSAESPGGLERVVYFCMSCQPAHFREAENSAFIIHNIGTIIVCIWIVF